MELSHPLNAPTTDSSNIDNNFFEDLRLEPKRHIEFEGRLREHAANIDSILQRTTRQSSPEEDVSNSINTFLRTSKVCLRFQFLMMRLFHACS